MIRGSVLRGRHAVVELTLIGTSGQRRRVRAMVDTGFDGWLTLPPNLIQSLRLPWFSQGSAELADGSQSFFDVYDATILWDRTRRQIFVSEADSIPLVGMALMKGYTLNMQIRSGGQLTLTRMS